MRPHPTAPAARGSPPPPTGADNGGYAGTRTCLTTMTHINPGGVADSRLGNLFLRGTASAGPRKFANGLRACIRDDALAHHLRQTRSPLLPFSSSLSLSLSSAHRDSLAPTAKVALAAADDNERTSDGCPSVTSAAETEQQRASLASLADADGALLLQGLQEALPSSPSAGRDGGSNSSKLSVDREQQEEEVEEEEEDHTLVGGTTGTLQVAAAAQTVTEISATPGVAAAAEAHEVWAESCGMWGRGFSRWGSSCSWLQKALPGREEAQEGGVDEGEGVRGVGQVREEEFVATLRGKLHGWLCE
jgi:hypothetical protein